MGRGALDTKVSMRGDVGMQPEGKRVKQRGSTADLLDGKFPVRSC